MRESLITVERGSQCSPLASFLRGRHAQPRMVDEHRLAIDLDDDGSPGLATLVAAVEEWRSSSCAGEISHAIGAAARSV